MTVSRSKKAAGRPGDVLAEEAIEKVITASKLETGQQHLLRSWLTDAHDEFLHESAEIAKDLTPAQIRAQLHRCLRPAILLETLLKHPKIQEYLDIDRIRAEPGNVSRERSNALYHQLKAEIGAITALKDRIDSARARSVSTAEFDQRYFGTKPAEEPHIDMLVTRASHFWVNELRRRPAISNSSDLVCFTRAVLACVAGRHVHGEAVRKRLRKLGREA